MKIGDKIRFLNTTGGGIIKGFQGKEIVLVEDESGFEIPVMKNECVVIEPAKENQVRQSTQPTAEIYQSAQVEEPEDEYEFEETTEGEQLSVHLAYLANEIKNLSTSGFDCYLVNESNYYLSFNYMSEAGLGWISRVQGIIEPNTKLFIEEFQKQNLNDIERVCIQLFAYKINKPYELKNTVCKEIKIDTTKFYKLHSFKENKYFEEPAIVYSVVNKDVLQKELTITSQDIRQAMMTKEVTKPEPKRLSRRQESHVIEVDLHANEILENTSGLSSVDILEYQLKIFRETLDEYKKKKGQRIVFIHGKGEGILKNALINELKKNYKPFTYQDASFQEYGFGATMITIK